MNTPLTEDMKIRLNTLAAILLRCFLFGVVAMLLVWGVFIVAGGPIHKLHSMLFEMSRHEFDMLVLAALTFIKSLNVVLFLFPYVAIKLLLRR